jgi:serine acetyltransferase
LNNSVVATGSVVVKKFMEEGVTIAGNPTKIVKRGINWKRERIYT